MLGQSIDTARQLHRRLCVVYGRGGEGRSVRLPMLTSSGPNRPAWLGTDHTPRNLPPASRRAGTGAVVMCTSLITVDTLRAPWLGGESLSLLTDTPADPAGYGRVVRQPDRTVRSHRQGKDRPRAESHPLISSPT